jgi:hypothetical protein
MADLNRQQTAAFQPKTAAAALAGRGANPARGGQAAQGVAKLIQAFHLRPPAEDVSTFVNDGTAWRKTGDSPGPGF